MCADVRRRFAIVSLLTAWLLATGSQWDAVQVFAWARMFTGYVSTMSVGQALEETFDADKPCALCCAVSQAKQQEKKELPNEVRLREKIVLVFQPVPILLAAAQDIKIWEAPVREPLSTDRSAPPVPPPRAWENA